MAFFLQSGDTNASVILQGGIGGGADSNNGYYAKVTQEGGNSNIAKVTQLGQVQATARSTVTQTDGGENQASVLQY